MEVLETLNQSLFLKINAPEGTAAWLISSATMTADGLIYVIPAILVVMWLWGDEQRRGLALKACVVSMIGVGLNQLIGIVLPHPRPFMIGLGKTWLSHPPDSSFPSDHMTVFCSVGFSLLFGGALRLGTFTLVCGLCVAWTRVFLGVHFPLDMLGAAGVALLCLGLVTPAWNRLGGAITQQAQGLYRGLLKLPINRGWIRR